IMARSSSPLLALIEVDTELVLAMDYPGKNRKSRRSKKSYSKPLRKSRKSLKSNKPKCKKTVQPQTCI
ncbi:GL10075, partial [Drosophila persimilis]